MSLQEVETQDRVLASWLTAERDPNDWLRVAYEAILPKGLELYPESRSVGG